MKSKILKTLLIIISIFAISISLSVHSIAEESGTNLTEETSSQTENSNELDDEETNELNNEENEVENNEETATNESSEEVTSNEGNEEITEESSEEVVANNNKTEESSEETSSNSENEEAVTSEETNNSNSQELNEENVEETSNNETSSTENTEGTEEEEEVVVTTRRLQSTPLRAQGSEGGEGEPQTIDYSLEINFKNQDGSDWDFDGIAPVFYITTSYENTGYPAQPCCGLEYTYTWNNGDSGSGTTDNFGFVRLDTAYSNEHNKVTITLKNIVEGSLLCVTKAYGTNYSKIEAEGPKYQWYVMSPETLVEATPILQFVEVTSVLQIVKDEHIEIDAYRGVDPVTINVRFLNDDGTYRNFEGNESAPEINFVYEKDSTGENNSKISDFVIGENNSIYTKKIYTNGEKILTVLKKMSWHDTLIEKITVNEDVVFDYVNSDGVYFNEDNEITATPGSTINIDCYMSPKTINGTIGFDSYDGTITEDYAYNFYFEFSKEYYSVADLKDMYWTYEGDDTKHYGLERANGDVAFPISIPIGKKVNMYNIPLQDHFCNAFGWPAGEIMNTTYSDVEHTRNITTISYKGENLTYEMIEQLGINKYVAYDRSKTTKWYHGREAFLDTSGDFYFFNLNDGFEINYYLFRTATQFMFKKELQDNANIEEDKQYHFQVNLKDEITGLPYTEKVAYYIYSDSEDVINPEEDVKYATPDENGNIDIYLSAGEYARIGRARSDTYIDSATELIYIVRGTFMKSNKSYDVYIPEIGMIPSNIAFEIVEIEDGYSYTVYPENSQKGISAIKDKQGQTYNIERDAVNNDGEITRPAYTAQQMFEYLDGITFTNSRKLGLLTVEKIVEGEDTDKEFNFNIKITDAAISFPLEYDYENSNGKTGKITFTAGNKITKETGEFTEYTANVSLKNGESITIKGIPAGAEYEVTEDEESAEGYTTESTGATGTIKADDSEEKSTATFTNTEIVEEPEEEKPVEKPEERPVEEPVKEKPVEEVKEEPIEEVEEVKEEKVVSIKTGDMIIVSIAIMAISMVGLAIIIAKKRNNK